MSLHSDSHSEERKQEVTLPAVQPNSACLVQVCCSLFLLPLMIKSDVTVGQAEGKHKNAASGLMQCFPNTRVFQDS